MSFPTKWTIPLKPCCSPAVEPDRIIISVGPITGVYHLSTFRIPDVNFVVTRAVRHPRQLSIVRPDRRLIRARMVTYIDHFSCVAVPQVDIPIPLAVG